MTRIFFYVFLILFSISRIVIFLQGYDFLSIQNKQKTFSVPLLIPIENEFSVSNTDQLCQVTISTSAVCDGGTIISVTSGSNNVFGQWYYQKSGQTNRVLLGEGPTLQFTSIDDLDGPGDYRIIFVVDSMSSQYCKPEEILDLKILLPGDVIFDYEAASASCSEPDGILVITAITDTDRILILREGTEIFAFPGVKAGEIIKIPNVEAGVYTARAVLGSCSKARTISLPQMEPAPAIAFEILEISAESCNTRGKSEGIIKIQLPGEGFRGKYNLFNGSGVIVSKGELDGQQEIEFSVPSNRYFFELVDENGCHNPSERFEVPGIDQVDFSVPSSFIICESFDFYPTTTQDIRFVLEYPDGQVVTREDGEVFTLDQGGDYILLGIQKVLDKEVCPKEFPFQVTLNKQVHFEPVLLERDCFGNSVFEANLFGTNPDKVDITWYNEEDVIVGKGISLNPESHGEFKLDVNPLNSENCPNPPQTFEVPRPFAEVSVALTATAFCPGKLFEIMMETNFEESIRTKWIYFDQNGEGGFLDEHDDEHTIETGKAGSYEVVVYSDSDCEIGRSSITIDGIYKLASFEVPEELVVCQSYDLFPETELNLYFTVIDPEGVIHNTNDREPINLIKSGTYTIISADAADVPQLCSEARTVSVIINQAFDYQPELIEQTCEGKLVYQANLFGSDPNSADFFWYNEIGELVSRDEIFVPETYGQFQLEVRPQGSMQCQEPSKSFEIIQPVVNLQAVLSATALCFDSEYAVLSLEADLSQVTQISWTYTDLDGVKVTMPLYSDLQTITSIGEGTYEVSAYNRIGCFLGSESVLIMRSTDERRPEVEEEFVICPAFGFGETIDPGAFSGYEWYLGNDLVATTPTFKPTAHGEYRLTVTSEENCNYTTSFKAIEECGLEIIVPNAIVHGDPNRSFLIYTNSHVDEVEVMIFSKLGEVIFYCKANNLEPYGATCSWDGLYKGKTIPNGAYATKINYRNTSNKVTKSIHTSILVIE